MTKLDLKEYCQDCPYIDPTAESEGTTLFAGDIIAEIEGEVKIFCKNEKICKRIMEIKGEGNER